MQVSTESNSTPHANAPGGTTAAAVHLLTTTGMRLSFPSLEKLSDWAFRMPSVIAVSKDGQTWRDYASFARFVERGNGVQAAYERAEAHKLAVPTPPPARRS